MVPIHSFKNLKDNWQYFGQIVRDYNFLLLYSDADKNIAELVREAYSDIDAMSGPKSYVFVIEKPPESYKDELASKEYWSYLSNRNKLFDDTIPYSKHDIYQIAESFKIEPKEIPCVVLFNDLNSDDIIIYHLNPDSGKEKLLMTFRRIFTIIRKYEREEAKNFLVVKDFLVRFEFFTKRILEAPLLSILSLLLNRDLKK